MAHTFECDATILGGFPIIARVWISPADPSVGVFSKEIDDVELFTTKGCPADFVVNRMTADDWTRLYEDLWHEYSRR